MVKKVVILLVILAVVGGGGWFFVQKKLRGGAPTATVRTEQVKRGRLLETVSAPGEIEPRVKVELSAKVSARITALPYDEGQRVTAGDPNANPPVPASILVQLDSKDLESQLQSAEAAYAAQAAQIEVEKARIAGQKATLVGLRASCEQARTDLERQEMLLDSNDISVATYDAAKLKVDEYLSQCAAAEHSLKAAELNLKVLEHNLEAADARVTQAREALSYTTIRAPIDGVVTRVNAEVGEVVIYGTMNNPGTVIMEVGDLSQMLVVAQVDEADVGKLEVGQRAVVHVDAYPDKEFVGKVHMIALSHTLSYTRTKYYRTEILLEETETKLHSGLTAHVDIETRRHEDVLKLPSQAVLGKQVDALPMEIRENSPLVDKKKTYATVVFKLADGKAVMAPVKIGHSDLTHTIIEEGIAEGDSVIIGPYSELEKLHHNKPVRDEKAKKDDKPDERGDDEADTEDPNERGGADVDHNDVSGPNDGE